ncbi:MAG TPA: hypothetical protein VMH00_15370 [Candidatus Limnocylindrales bacterium]|nr:hypothetical protein [Candidatus Limnocylindrales bacterium]
MKAGTRWLVCGFAVLLMALGALPQDRIPESSSRGANVSAEYPKDRAGILIRGTDWISIRSEMPTKSRVKHALAPTFTYGAAPAEIISEYEGLHAQASVATGRPVVCICHFTSLPGNPVIVRLHPKKNLRELDGGKIHIGVKMEEAEKSDLIPVDVSRPEDMVWLIQPQQTLPPGEYAVMLGTQNVSIFPFSVTDSGATPSSPAKQ